MGNEYYAARAELASLIRSTLKRGPKNYDELVSLPVFRKYLKQHKLSVDTLRRVLEYMFVKKYIQARIALASIGREPIKPIKKKQRK